MMKALRYPSHRSGPLHPGANGLADRCRLHMLDPVRVGRYPLGKAGRSLQSIDIQSSRVRIRRPGGVLLKPMLYMDGA